MALHSQEPRRLMPAGEATTVPADAGANGVGAARSWLDALAKPTAFVALLGYPLTLTSPGATVAMILVGLYGLALALRDGLPEDLRRVHRSMLACYLLVVVVDVLNGGGWANFESAGNYLVLLALAPYANALRRLHISPAILDWTIAATLLLATALSCFQMWVFVEARPGGFHLASVGYGVVVSMLATLLFSRALQYGDHWRWWLFVSAAAFIPVLLSGSKIAIACIMIGFFVVSVIWAKQNDRWRAWVLGGVAAGCAFSIAFYWLAFYRLQALIYELKYLYINGQPINESFGSRYQMNEIGVKTFLHKPVLGYGLAERMSAFRAEAGGGAAFVDVPYIHSDYVTHLVAFGIFGLVFLLLYLFLIYRLSNRSGEVAYRRAGLAIIAMLTIYMAADVAFNMDPIGAVLTLVLGAVLSRAPAERVAAADGAVDGKSTKPD